MTFESRSQAGQDRAVFELLRGKRAGSFLDIGASHPVERSNSYALETELGWRGLLVDNSLDSMLACEKERKSAFLLTDASQPQNWIAALRQADELNGGTVRLLDDSVDPGGFVIDYLSLDIDAASLSALQYLPFDVLRFNVVTIEHDAYRAGPGPRAEMLSILRKYSYDILCADVMDQGLPFEIWACHSWANIPRELKDRFRRDQPTEWRELFK